MRAVVLCCALLPLVFAGALFTESEYQSRFASWMNTHSKTYSSESLRARYAVFKANMDLVHRHNHAMPKPSYSMALNQFADMTTDEFTAVYASTMTKTKPHAKPVTSKPNKHLPPSFDWRDHGAVNAIQDQGQCGSCWAFTTQDAVAGIWAIKTGMLIELSAQQIVDFSGAFGCQGCNGGLIDGAFQYVESNHGLCEWNEYKYTAQTGSCVASNCTNVATVSSHTDIAVGDENALQQAVAMAPVAAAVDATSFQFYSSGIYDNMACGTQIDHGMTIIGWSHGPVAGVDTPYWILRNMWSASWGEKGYMRLLRGKNLCGVAQAAVQANLQLPA